VLLEGQVAELVDDEQLGLGKEADLLAELALGLRTHERGHERRGGHEEHRVEGLDDGRPRPMAR
jgi:hypothetical protein